LRDAAKKRHPLAHSGNQADGTSRDEACLSRISRHTLLPSPIQRLHSLTTYSSASIWSRSETSLVVSTDSLVQQIPLLSEATVSPCRIVRNGSHSMRVRRERAIPKKATKQPTAVKASSASFRVRLRLAASPDEQSSRWAYTKYMFHGREGVSSTILKGVKRAACRCLPSTKCTIVLLWRHCWMRFKVVKSSLNSSSCLESFNPYRNNIIVFPVSVTYRRRVLTPIWEP
jgi:hypothetical protein